MSLHMPEAARIKRRVDLTEDRERLFADAFGEPDNEALLFGDDPVGWKDALDALILDTDADISAVNAELSAARYQSQRRDPAKRRAELVDQKTALMNRRRFVKTLLRVPPDAASRVSIETYEGTKFEQAQAHIRAANRLLKEWAADNLQPGGATS